MPTNTQETDDGGRFGRTPYRPEDLKAEWPTTDSGRLAVTCPSCKREWYPSSKCCVDRYAGDPFCPDCGTDFRALEKIWGPKVQFYDPEDLADGNGGEDVTDDVKAALEALDAAHENIGEMGDTQGLYPVWEARKHLKEAFGDMDRVIRSRKEDSHEAE